MYKLIIETDSYAGNFERELIIYSFGMLPNGSGSFTAYARPFWDSTVGTGVETYENYLAFRNQRKKEKSNEEILSEISHYCIRKDKSDKELIAIYHRIQDKLEAENILHLYDYLEYTMQEVDDWKENTFYNLCEDSNSLFVQLKDILPERFEKIVIEQITKFFNLDIYNKIKDYEYLCMFDDIDRKHDEPITLNRIYIIDENENIVKTYFDNSTR